MVTQIGQIHKDYSLCETPAQKIKRLERELKEEKLKTEILNLMIDESIAIYNSQRPNLNLNYKTPNFIHEKAAELIRSTA